MKKWGRNAPLPVPLKVLQHMPTSGATLMLLLDLAQLLACDLTLQRRRRRVTPMSLKWGERLAQSFTCIAMSMTLANDSGMLTGANSEDANVPPHSVIFSRAASDLNCKDESCEATPQAVSDWAASDDKSSSDNRNNSEEDRVDSTFLELEDSQHILNSALDELHHGHIPTDLGPLATVDKALDVWNDWDRLQRASVTLSAMSRNTNFDAVLRAHLTGMVGVLNIYLDPDLQYTWRKASVMVSKVEGKGVNHARMLRQWILKFIQSEEVP